MFHHYTVYIKILCRFVLIIARHTVVGRRRRCISYRVSSIEMPSFTASNNHPISHRNDKYIIVILEKSIRCTDYCCRYMFTFEIRYKDDWRMLRKVQWYSVIVLCFFPTPRKKYRVLEFLFFFFKYLYK